MCIINQCVLPLVLLCYIVVCPNILRRRSMKRLITGMWPNSFLATSTPPGI